MLCFFLAVLNPVSLAAGTTNSSGAAGFSLPLVPHYRTEAGILEELLPEGDAEEEVPAMHTGEEAGRLRL